MKADLTYTQADGIVSFLPETPAGEQAWRELVEQNDDTHMVPWWKAKSLCQQLRSAGYSVQKRKPRAMSGKQTDALLAALGVTV